MTPAEQYLLKVLNWKEWGKHHTLLVEAIKDVLIENICLRERLKCYEQETEDNSTM
jgi:hypothetical protein